MFRRALRGGKTARHPNSLSMIRSLKKQWITARGRLGANTVPRMESEEKFMDFHATCYETSLIIDDFRLPGYFNWGKTTPAARRTEARLLTDGTMLYIRLTAENPSPELMEKSAPDLWPSGDHIELRFETGEKHSALLSMETAIVTTPSIQTENGNPAGRF